jgi:hypothetical protein
MKLNGDKGDQFLNLQIRTVQKIEITVTYYSMIYHRLLSVHLFWYFAACTQENNELLDHDINC